MNNFYYRTETIILFTVFILFTDRKAKYQKSRSLSTTQSTAMYMKIIHTHTHFISSSPLRLRSNKKIIESDNTASE